jgi:hypothetical protein
LLIGFDAAQRGYETSPNTYVCSNTTNLTLPNGSGAKRFSDEVVLGLQLQQKQPINWAEIEKKEHSSCIISPE